MNLNQEKNDVLQDYGYSIATDIKEHLKGGSPTLKVEVVHAISEKNPFEIHMFFTVTDLGGSEEDDVSNAINDRLLKLLSSGQLTQYKIVWGFKVS